MKEVIRSLSHWVIGSLGHLTAKRMTIFEVMEYKV